MTDSERDNCLFELSKNVACILERLDGHVPTKCILHEQAITELQSRRTDWKRIITEVFVGVAIAAATVLFTKLKL